MSVVVVVVNISRSIDDTNDESLLPPLPQTETECTQRKLSNRQLNDPSFRNELESQIEDAIGKIEIIDGVIVRWLGENALRIARSSCVFSAYGNWADDQDGVFCVGNVGFTLGNNTRVSNAFYRKPGNIPPRNICAHLLAQTTAPDMILETEFEFKRGEAETKITSFWLQNGVQEAWLLVVPNPDDNVATSLVSIGGAPPLVPLPVVPMTQVRPPAAPYVAIYIPAANNNNDPPLLGYFPIDWHSEFQPPPQSILAGAPPINCDRFMRRFCAKVASQISLD
jgi:hypothetical protein